MLYEGLYKIMDAMGRLDKHYGMLVEGILMEAMSLDDVHQKYYQKIPIDTFKSIVGADPTSDGEHMGKYSKWLLSIYAKGNLKEEDLYKANEYLATFDKFKGKIQKKDINTYRTLPELYDSVRTFMENPEQATSKSEEARRIKNEGAEKVYEDSEWLVIVPHTEEAAKYYGKGTQWCTAAEYHNQFSNYNSQGLLYININKRSKEKYQFHFESGQFMDETDDPINYNIGLSEGLLDFYTERYKGKATRLYLFSVGDVGEYSRVIGYFLENDCRPEDIFSEIIPLSGSAYFGWLDDSYYFLCDGDWVSEDYFSYVEKPDNHGMCLVEFVFEDEGGNWNFLRIDESGTYSYLSDTNFFNAGSFDDNGFAVVENDEGYNIIDVDGALLSDIGFDTRPQEIEGNIYYAERDKKTYYIDTQDRTVFGGVGLGENRSLYGLVPTKMDDGKYNVFSIRDKDVLFEQTFDAVYIGKLYIVLQNGYETSISDHDGNILLNTVYDSMQFFGYNIDNIHMFWVKKDGLYNVIDLEQGTKPIFKEWLPSSARPQSAFRGDEFKFTTDEGAFIGNKNGTIRPENKQETT